MPSVRIPVLPGFARWAAVVLVAGFVFYTSIVTTPPSDPIVPTPGPPDLLPLDKWRHFLAYGGLAVGLWYATLDWDRRTTYVALFVLGIPIAYGVGLEVWQSFVPNRYFSVDDAYANLLGSLISLPLLVLRRRVDVYDVPDDLPGRG